VPIAVVRGGEGVDLAGAGPQDRDQRAAAGLDRRRDRTFFAVAVFGDAIYDRLRT
jgi:hypothetical protein